MAFSAPPFSAGGVASAHFNLFRALQSEGQEARFFTFGEYRRKDEADIIRHGAPPWLVKLLLKINGRLFELLQPGKRAYQTVDIFTSWIGASRMSRAITEFAPDIIILSDHGAPGLTLKKPKGAKIILVSHHNPARFIATPEMADFSVLDARWALKLEQRVLAKVDAVVCPSTYMKHWFERSYHFSGPIRVIPNLLDERLIGQISPADLRAQFNLKPDDILIYMPSAGSRLKGAQYVLDIIRGLCAQTEKTLGFYIPGTVVPELLERAAGLPSNARLCLTGQIPYVEHIAYVKACSFGMSPSVIENYSMALLEAVHCGVPLLAFDTGGNADIIHNDKNGYLVAERNVEALWKAAIPLLTEKILKALKRRTQAYSRRELSSQKPLRAYLELANVL